MGSIRTLLTFQERRQGGGVITRSRSAERQRSRSRVIVFADYWKHASGDDEPSLLVFDSKVMAYTVLDEMFAQGTDWLTLPRPGRRELDHLASLDFEVKSVRIDRASDCRLFGCRLRFRSR